MEIQIFKSVSFTTTPKGEKKGQECSTLTTMEIYSVLLRSHFSTK